MTMLLIAVAVIVTAAAGLVIIRTLTTGTPPVPSGAAMRSEMIAQCRLAIDTESVDRVVELGSGWGGLTARLAAAFDAFPVVGVEISVVPHLWSQFATARRAENLQYRRADLLLFAIEPGDLLVGYLSRPLMTALAARLQSMPRSDSPVWIVSSTFSLPGYEPHSLGQVSDLYRSPIYLYRVHPGPI